MIRRLIFQLLQKGSLMYCHNMRNDHLKIALDNVNSNEVRIYSFRSAFRYEEAMLQIKVDEAKEKINKLTK